MIFVSQSRGPSIAVAVYLLLLGMSVVLIFVSEDSLAGIFSVILTLPWSVAVTGLVEAAFSGVGETASGVVGVLVGGAVNGAIVYAVARFVSRRRRTRVSRPA